MARKLVEDFAYADDRDKLRNLTDEEIKELESRIDRIQRDLDLELQDKVAEAVHSFLIDKGK